MGSEATTKCREAADGKPILALHIRRTDKLNHEDRKYTIEEYLHAAALNHWSYGLVFIATDAPVDVKQEAEASGINYFMLPHRAKGWDIRNAFSGNQQFLSEVACLIDADFFVDSVKSNVAFLVQAWRKQDATTAVGMDAQPVRKFY